ncbi:hypothetical protein ABEW34_29455 [Paenibacillus algorifonticola]|uniref:hypothetical protein n=1 Tax=Paenibacillus algorifonticola TaxID=684063 RepID=UPI003D2652DF
MHGIGGGLAGLDRKKKQAAVLLVDCLLLWDVEQADEAWLAPGCLCAPRGMPADT